MKSVPGTPSTKRGRPRAFDADAALDAALGVFWRRGFEAASLDELTEAMGINRPSLYAAFGNKESLFARVVDRYAQRQAGKMRDALAGSPARDVVETFLRAAASGGCSADAPRGCMLVGATLTCGEASGETRRAVDERRGESRVILLERLERAKREGELPPDTDVAGLARFFATVMLGLSVSSAGGATRAEQLAVVDQAMRAWPAPKRRR